MPERRKHGRQAIVLRGTVLPRDSLAVIICTIRDLSEGGARLQSAQLKSIPDRFDLLIHFQAGKVERHHCQVVWKDKDQLGLSFQPAGSPWQPARGVN